MHAFIHSSIYVFIHLFNNLPYYVPDIGRHEAHSLCPGRVNKLTNLPCIIKGRPREGQDLLSKD